MSAGSVATPPPLSARADSDTDWLFAPHMYGNPFQQILAEGLGARGIAARGVRDIEGCLDLVKRSTKPNRVVHLHWLNVVLAGAKTASEEQRRIAKFQRFLEDVKSAGAKLAWTVHNVLPHEGYSEESALAVRHLICDYADLIHVMSPDTEAACAPYFTLPAAKLVRLEHPGYHGFYPAVAEGLDLRAKWGLPAGGKLVVILGGIKPYKGLNEFTEAFAAATSADPRALALLIAGKPSEPIVGSALGRTVELSPNLHVLAETVADSQVSELMTMADAVAIPYQASLNSGSMVLALTYGKPVIARSSAGSTHLLQGGAGRVYEDETQLVSELADLSWLPAAGERARELSGRLDRQRLTTRFAELARAFVDSGIPAARAAAGSNGGLDD